MDSNKRIMLVVFSMVAGLMAVIVMLIAFGSRTNAYQSAKKRAYLAAEIVKSGLTAHMLNGMMENRDFFLNSMKSLDGVDDLWIVRAKSVSKQFGKSDRTDEQPRDIIDERVLLYGEEITTFKESLLAASMRVTIPYVASRKENPDCMQCHDAKEGDVLGIISLRFDMQDDRVYTTLTLLKISVIAIISLIIILYFIRSTIKPYIGSFDNISLTLKALHYGDYSVRAQGGIFKEDKEASKWLNEIIEKLESVLTKIENNLAALVHGRGTDANGDKLIIASTIIEEISDTYNFKKTIETDLDKEDIIYRLAQILKDKLNIENFTIYEDDLRNSTRTISYKSNDHFTPCCNLTEGVNEGCRSQRTNSIVDSDVFPEICREATCSRELYLCVPFKINAEKSFVVSMICKTKEEAIHAKSKIGTIRKYFEEAKPIIESKLLMQELRERNFIDALTQLYNRKFLDELVEKQLPKDLKEGVKYGVMMLDIDYFKMVNDTYGHDVGDAILEKLSEIMRGAITKEDHAIRYGGEEFLILIKNYTEAKVDTIARNINKSFAKTKFTYNNETFNKTVSIGYSCYPDDADLFYKCVKYADLCLYEAKKTGRNKVVKFNKTILNEYEDNY